MALAGIILQALAGFIYGVSYLIGTERIERWEESAKDWLANPRNRIVVSYLLMFFTPLAFAIYFVGKQENNVEWYNLIPGVIIFWGFPALTYTGFLLSITKSKKLANIFSNPNAKKVILNSNITLIILGIILMILGGILFERQAGFIIGTDISSIVVPIIVVAFALTTLVTGFFLVFMPGIYYLYILFVNCVSILLKPGKVVWILVLTIFLAGSGFLIADEIIPPN